MEARYGQEKRVPNSLASTHYSRLLASGGGDASIKLWSLHKQMSSILRLRRESENETEDIARYKPNVTTYSFEVSNLVSPPSTGIDCGKRCRGRC